MLKNICLFVCLAILSSCGGGSTTTSDTADTAAPTVSTVTTDNGGTNTALSSTAGETRVSGSLSTELFTITFSEAMDPATVIADNITLTCNNEAFTVGTPATSDDIAWTIPLEVDLTGYVGCTLTLGTGLKDAAGNALAEAATYAFNTQCSTNDAFIVDTLGFTSVDDTEGNCWNYTTTGQTTSRATAFTIDTTNALLTFSADSNMPQESYHFIYKTFNASSFVALLKIVSPPPAGAGCYLHVLNGNNSQTTVSIKASGLGCSLSIPPQDDVSTVCGQNENITQQNPLYLQLTWDGTNVSAKYAYESVNNLSALNAPASTVVSLGDSYKVGITCEGTGNSSWGQTIDSFTIDATATGPGTQY